MRQATLWGASFDDDEAARVLGNERRTMIRLSDDYAEGRQAFLEKRPPEFRCR